ncbi:MAG: DUF7286 family protein [Methanosarcina sp.]
MAKRSPEELLSFIQNTDAYIPFAVIGIFIVLAATFTSVYLLKMDCEVAETIYTTQRTDPKQTAVSLAVSDLTRCLNYAGMEALEWQGEHPVIVPEGTPVEKISESGFILIPKNQNLEKGDTLEISINLPSDVWGKIESLWKEKNVILVAKDTSGNEIKTLNYGQATGFFQKVSFEHTITIPETAASGYASIELYYGDKLKASDWFMIEISPVKDITANSFNRLLAANYQDNTHTFMQYAINVEPDLKPEQVKIRKVEGTLQREISSPDKKYTIYYIFEIPSLNYTLVDLESRKTVNNSLKLSTLVTSREPLLEELVREYEVSLENSSSLDSTSNLVLGATNLRTFIYGPWQHYANGPLNILTNPALSSSINGATLYTQKRIFDSVDPLALTYTTYYNGKVIYEDVSNPGNNKNKETSSVINSNIGSNNSNTGSNRSLNSGMKSGNSGSSDSGYETRKSINLTTTYDSLADNKSFSLDVEDGIGESLKETDTSIEKLSQSSKIEVSASDYTDGVIDGWVFNDHVWTEKNPDLIHAITASVYRAPVQGQVLRDGFRSPKARDSKIISDFDSRSTSFDGHAVNWGSKYLVSGTHTGALIPSYSLNNSAVNSYSESLSPAIKPPKGNLVRWSLKGASVNLLSSEITDVMIEPQYSYESNDRLIFMDRNEGYLNREDHVFDWRVRYDISYKIKTKWKISYSYEYTYKWKSREKLPDGNFTIVTHSDSSSGSDLEITDKVDSETLSHFETESENLTLVYHRRPPTEGYTGLSTYSDPVEREYSGTSVYLDYLDGIQGNDQNKNSSGTSFDPCCSDAADKYRETYVDIREIERNHWVFPDGKYLFIRTINCDIPAWLHRAMAEDVLSMLDSIENDNPTFNYSLVDSPGRDPTDQQVKTAGKLVRYLESNRENYVNKKQHLTSAGKNKGKIHTLSDSARYIARNEAYNRLLKDIEYKNTKLESDLNSYILEALKKKGLDTGKLDSVTSGSMTLFNNPAIQRASSALGQNMGIISTMAVTGQPESKYNWTENLTLIIDQKPNYLYHDPDFDLRKEYEWTDTMTGRTIYPLGVRNTCIFTTGISEEIGDAIASNNEYVKTETSQQISQSIYNLNREVYLLEQNLKGQKINLDFRELDKEIYNLKKTYAQEMRQEITEGVLDEVNSNPVISSWIKTNKVRQITIIYLDGLSDDQIIKKSTTDRLASELAELIKSDIRNSNPQVPPDELEATLNRVDTDVRIGVSNGICAVTVKKGKALDSSFEKIDSELKKLDNKAVNTYSSKTGAKISKKLDKAMAAIPCGMPVLPPHWVFTVNVWTYEIVGKYQVFTVIDNDNEVIPQPYFGHKGQRYTRKEEHINHPFLKNKNGGSIWIGRNTQLTFYFTGYSSTVVGPGPKGVGDKSGGYEEISAGYDQLISELGAIA